MSLDPIEPAEVARILAAIPPSWRRVRTFDPLAEAVARNIGADTAAIEHRVLMTRAPWSADAVADVMAEIAIAAADEREVERVMTDWRRILTPPKARRSSHRGAHV